LRWVRTDIHIMPIKSIIETDTTPCCLTSEQCLSVKEVTGYGEDVAVLLGVCFDLNGTSFQHDAHGLKAEIRVWTVAYPLSPSQSIFSHFPYCAGMAEMDSNLSTRYSMSDYPLRDGVRRYPLALSTTSARPCLARFSATLNDQRPLQRYRLGEITRLRRRRVCD
jgi:hypothetical protein